jgi:glutamate carboxypeptidase
MRLTTYLLLFYTILSLPLQAQNSRIENKIIEQIDEHNDYAVHLLQKLVNINSGSMNSEGVKQIADMLIPEFQALGFKTQWIDGKDWGRGGHLVAVHKGSGKGPNLLLIGHLDTVFEPDNPYQEYVMRNDSIMAGPGVVDMKGGDVIALFALKALKEAGALKDMTIEVIYTGDEEKSGSPLSLSKRDLVEAAKRSDIALGFENGDSNPATAVVSRRGSTSWELKVKGNPAHSSQIFSEKIGAGAIYETSRILIQFYEQLSEEKYLTFNPGVILGGTSVSFDSKEDGGEASGKTNVVAQDVVVSGDIRAVSPEQLDRAKKVMMEIISESLPQTSAELTFSDSGYPPLAPTEGNNKLLSLYSQVSEDLGFGPVGAVIPINAGAADISFTSGHVDMAIDGLGLSGGNDHTVNEYGNINWLPRLTKRAAILIYRLNAGVLNKK